MFICIPMVEVPHSGDLEIRGLSMSAGNGPGTGKKVYKNSLALYFLLLYNVPTC